MNKLEVIILAAGKGTRMKSSLPKVLHPLAGKPLLQHVIDTSRQLQAHKIHVVYGHGGESVKEAVHDEGINWVEQDQQLGTAHAVEMALPTVDDSSLVLVLYGDVPLISKQTLQQLLEQCQLGMALLTVEMDDPSGYGRIVRNDMHEVQAIVEHKDADEAIRAIREVNTGILAAHGDDLKRWISAIENKNAQAEYYLTDTIALAVNEGKSVHALKAQDINEVSGVNDRAQLATLERHHQHLIARALMLSGVTLLDPQRIDVRGVLKAEQDVSIDINCVFEGEVSLGTGVSIGANCVIKDSVIAANVSIKPNSVIEDAVIGEGCIIGPFARIRPGTELAQQVHIGNFVEIKNSVIAAASKVNHLSYVGDTDMGKEVNIGAGTITCNYDGANKFRTIIGDRVFVGSDTQLIAPVTVADGTTIGAGSTITKDTEAETLVLSRSPQKSIKGWQRPQKKR